jgi:uncharacterized membrane protein
LRNEITKLVREQHALNLLDVAVAVRYPDGCLTLNGDPFPAVAKVQGGTLARILASLALAAPPLTAEAVRPFLASVSCIPETARMSERFVREVAELIKPGTSVLFVLDEVGNLDVILRGIRGLGGTVIKTNVDLDRGRLIQFVLDAPPETTLPHGQ